MLTVLLVVPFSCAAATFSASAFAEYEAPCTEGFFGNPQLETNGTGGPGHNIANLNFVPSCFGGQVPGVFASAFSILATGDVAASVIVAKDFFDIAEAYASLNDTLYFNLGNGASLGTGHLNAGIIANGGSLTIQLGTIIPNTQSYLDPFTEVDVETSPTCAPGTFPQGFNGIGQLIVVCISPPYKAGQTIISIPFPIYSCPLYCGASESISVTAQVSVGNINGSLNGQSLVEGIGDPMTLTLPPGATYTSNSGVFLTASTPEQGSLVGVGFGLAMIGLSLVIKRRTALRRNW